jgi:type IX secretion system PorP/SprF family membrane protein
MKKQHFILILWAIFGTTPLYSQDIHFSQFYLSPVHFNPAYSGALKDIDISMQYKGQWKTIDKGYRTFGANVSSRLNYKRIKKNFWAMGISALGDQVSLQKLLSLRVNIPIAHTVKLNTLNTLTNAISLGFGQNVLKDENFSWGAQYNGMNYDPALPTNEIPYINQFSFLDIGYGFSWNYNQQTRTVSDVRGFSNTFGFSASHINRPIFSFNENSNERLDIKYIFFESATIHLKNSKISWNPSLLYQIQGGHREFILGTLIRYELEQESRITGFREGSAISAGVFVRNKDAVVFSSLYEFSNFQIGISYDVNTSELNNSTSFRGGLEICLKYITPSPFSMGGRSLF